MNGLYYDKFCEDGNNGDACAVATQAIDNGPNTLGDRFSNVSLPRNSYKSSSPYDCDKHY